MTALGSQACRSAPVGWPELGAMVLPEDIFLAWQRFEARVPDYSSSLAAAPRVAPVAEADLRHALNVDNGR